MTERYKNIRKALATGPWMQGGNGQSTRGHQFIAWVDNEPYMILNCNQHIYDALVKALDEMLDEIGGQERHPLAALASQIGDLIAAYDALHYPLPEAPGHDVLD